MVAAWILLASDDDSSGNRGGGGERNMVVAVTGNGDFGSGAFGKEKGNGEREERGSDEMEKAKKDDWLWGFQFF